MLIKKKDLIESLRRVALIIDEDIRAVKMSIKEGVLILSSKKAGFGEAREEIEIKYSGEEIEVGLNSRYVLDILNAIEGEDVYLEILDGKTPI